VTTARELRLDPTRQYLRIAAPLAGSPQATPLQPSLSLTKSPLASPEDIAEAKRRFNICKACENARDDGFACTLHPTCCFGRWRGNPENHCPVGLW
jgi:hypothetical protein